MTPMPRLRHLAMVLAGTFAMSGCYGLAEPSYDPGDARDVLALLVRRGIVTSEPMAGKTACDDRDLVGNALYMSVRLPDETEPRDLYVHTYRERRWEESKAEVDACMAEYAAAHPDAEIVRLDIPTYRVFGADWSEALTEELRKVFEEAQHAG